MKIIKRVFLHSVSTSKSLLAGSNDVMDDTGLEPVASALRRQRSPN